MVQIANDVTAANLPCGQSHTWQTFAIALLPKGARTYNYSSVAANPVVRAVCSVRVLLMSLRGQARRVPGKSWTIDVLPPDQAAFLNGARAYRCVASLRSGAQTRTSAFGP